MFCDNNQGEDNVVQDCKAPSTDTELVLRNKAGNVTMNIDDQGSAASTYEMNKKLGGKSASIKTTEINPVRGFK